MEEREREFLGRRRRVGRREEGIKARIKKVGLGRTVEETGWWREESDRVTDTQNHYLSDT